MKRVVWSIVGSGGYKEEDEVSLVLDLTSRFPNITGVMMDDFFTKDGTGRIELDNLRNIRNKLAVSERRLDLWVVLYTHQLELPVTPYLELCDFISLWTWNSDNLSELESNFQRLEQLSCDKRKALGCYMWDFHNSKPMPIPLMEKQCNIGLKWLMEGRLDEIIFLANTVCDVHLDVVEWTRRWIQEVADKQLTH